MIRYRQVRRFTGYRVGDDGSVWSCRRQGCKSGLTGVWKRLKCGTHPAGHKIVGLRRGGKTHTQYVHHLVLEAFVGPCPPGKICRHFPDQSPANNRLDNIQWGTWEQNNGCDKIMNGTTNRGSQCGSSKLTEDDVKQIRRRIDSGDPGWQIAMDYKVKPSTVCDIKTRRTWKHI